jgi:hypothetical protein
MSEASRLMLALSHGLDLQADATTPEMQRSIFRGLAGAAMKAAMLLDGKEVGGYRLPVKPADEDLANDVAAGLSLRQCADKHGVGVGRVRGAVIRAKPTAPPAPRG